VVSSPGRDLLVTAAHCINGGPHGGARSDIVFIRPYHARNIQLRFDCDGFISYSAYLGSAVRQLYRQLTA
jgi:V8-like Glu-specific endopeptidase